MLISTNRRDYCLADVVFAWSLTRLFMEMPSPHPMEAGDDASDA